MYFFKHSSTRDIVKCAKKLVAPVMAQRKGKSVRSAQPSSTQFLPSRRWAMNATRSWHLELTE